MFRIGEFAQIAQVSGRQLRFYDQLGLLRPAHTDPQTGYRYYSIRQLPRLNGILALKELGLSLEQIGPLLKNDLPSAELRGRLTMKRAQLEQSRREEETRLRYIESRIAEMDRLGIDLQLLLLTSPGVQLLDRDTAKRVAAESNDQLADAIAKYPTRFDGLDAVAPQDPQAAAREL